MEIELIDPMSGMVEATNDELAAWMVARGNVMIYTAPDGRRYRVLEPGERGPFPALSRTDTKEG